MAGVTQDVSVATGSMMALESRERSGPTTEPGYVVAAC